ncbi:MAG: phosphoribosylanthranilate isomerase [Hyphomicrobiaceae bacterium]
MTTDVKICGLSTPATMTVALDAGADYVGLVFFPPSPRTLDMADAVALAEMARGKAKIVALTVDPDDALVDAIAANLRPDIFQLHGSETPERATAIKLRSGCAVMKAVKVATRDDAESAFAYAAPEGPCDMILFDAKAPKDAVLPGGNGLTFDWRALEGVAGRLNYMLSGGLTSDNVGDAVRLTGANAVDVSSGVESAPGTKDIALIRAFLKSAKAV